MSAGHMLGFGMAAVIVVLVAEMILAARWTRAYFAYGIPIFVRRVPRPQGIADLSLDELQASTATAAGAPLLFRRLGPDLIAFREQMLSGGVLHYAPIMHGSIRHDAMEGAVRVVGVLNWFVTAFVALLAAMLGREVLAMLPIAGAAAAVIYFIQAMRYNRVAKKLAR
ncbi:MAG TPA: hypothetical protein VM733_07210 [Thermoanaerobaculia bacterium]|nr:hypothetical protein [Thermoanaerobaculia bacterium]